MAKKIERRQRRSARRLGLSIAGLVVAATMIAGGLAAVRHRSSDNLPLRADLAGRSPELRAALADAQARAGAVGAGAGEVAALGRLYQANGFAVEAERCWLWLGRAAPREGRWCYYLADLSRTAGDQDGQWAWLEQTVRRTPDYAPAWLQWADLAFKTGRIDAAEHAYRERLALAPGDPYASLGLARVAFQRGQRAAATRLIVDLVEREPGLPSGHNLYAEVLATAGEVRAAAEQRRLGSAAGRFRAAEDPWIEELREVCFDAERLIEWGEGQRQTRQGDRGRARFERALQLAPGNVHAYERLGAFYLDANEPGAAVGILERGRALPDASEALFGQLCDAYHALHDPAGELRAADAGLQLFPQASILHNGRAHALVARQRTDEAIAEYRLAVANAPYAADPVANLGALLQRLGRHDEASSAFQHALALQPMYPKALVLLASLEIDIGDLAAAAPRVDAIFEQDPASPGARALVVRWHLARAMQAVARDDVAAAEQACREGLKRVPDSPEVLGFLGAYYLQQDRTDEAAKVLETAHRQRPDDPRVTLSLGEARARQGRREDARRLLAEAAQQARGIGETALAARCGDQLERLGPP